MKKFLPFVLIFMFSNIALSDPLLELFKKAESNSSELLKVASILIEADRKKEAEQLLKKALQNPGTEEKARLQLALLKISAEKTNQAKSTCQKLSTKKNSKNTKLCMANLWLNKNDPAKALEYFQEVLKNHDDEDAIIGSAKAYSLSGNNTKAISLLEELLKSSKRHDLMVQLGLLYEKTNKKNEALAIFEQAVTTCPNSPVARYNLARILPPGQDSIDHLEKALELKPNWLEAQIFLGHTQLEQKQFNEAILTFEKVNSIDNSKSVVFLGLGKAHYSLSNNTQAKEALQKASSLDPDCLETALLLSRVETTLGKSKRVSRLSKKASFAEPKNYETAYSAGEVFLKQKRYTRANYYFTEALKHNPQSTAAAVSLGDIACERKMYKRGRDYYQNALNGDLLLFSKDDIQKRIKDCR